jgi:SAM-dependent methyltransferase
MVELLDPQPDATLLELAAGPGDTGFLAAERLDARGRLISTDVVAEMVDAARRRGEELGVRNVEFRTVDAAAIDLPDAHVDGVLCRWGVMLVPDCEAAARETARVLRPGAGAVLAVWAEPDRNDWMTAAGRSALALGLGERPPPDAPGPFRFAEPRRLPTLLENAGLDVEIVEEVAIEWRAESLREWWEVVLDTSRMLANAVSAATPSQVKALRAGAEERLAAYVQDDGAVVVPGAARVALARRPAS